MLTSSSHKKYGRLALCERSAVRWRTGFEAYYAPYAAASPTSSASGAVCDELGPLLVELYDTGVCSDPATPFESDAGARARDVRDSAEVQSAESEQRSACANDARARADGTRAKADLPSICAGGARARGDGRNGVHQLQRSCAFRLRPCVGEARARVRGASPCAALQSAQVEHASASVAVASAHDALKRSCFLVRSGCSGDGRAWVRDLSASVVEGLLPQRRKGSSPRRECSSRRPDHSGWAAHELASRSRPLGSLTPTHLRQT
jgi:hypothetical protein